MSGWRSSSDFEADLREFSEIEVCNVEETHDEPPPPSILQWRARVAKNNTSLFEPDYNTLIDEDVTYIFSGRGRGIVSKTYRPGYTHIAKDNTEEDDIRRRIRQETGFIGHNEIIEKKYSGLFSDSNKPKNNELSFADADETPPDAICVSSESESPIIISSDTESCTKQQKSTPTSPAALPLSVLRRKARKQLLDGDVATSGCSSSEDDVNRLITLKGNINKNNNNKNRESSPLNLLQKSSNDDQWWSCTSNGSDCSCDDTTNTSTSSSLRGGGGGSNSSRSSSFFVNDYFNIDKPVVVEKTSQTLLNVDSVHDFPPL